MFWAIVAHNVSSYFVNCSLLDGRMVGLLCDMTFCSCGSVIFLIRAMEYDVNLFSSLYVVLPCHVCHLWYFLSHVSSNMAPP